MEEESEREETANLSVKPESHIKQGTRLRMLSFAVVTLVALAVSLSSLTIISSRQSGLASAEEDMRVLQERITGSIFLSLDAENKAGSQKVVDQKTISATYHGLKTTIDNAQFRISNGLSRSRGDDIDTTELDVLLGVYTLSLFSNNTLLGILLISCGVLGSIMSTMRNARGHASKAVVLGATVGFITLLGVKGGATVFIMSASGVDVPFNPYSTAFAGVVAGMFSEKLYVALSRLTDKAFRDSDDANKAQ